MEFTIFLTSPLKNQIESPQSKSPIKERVPREGDPEAHISQPPQPRELEQVLVPAHGMLIQEVPEHPGVGLVGCQDYDVLDGESCRNGEIVARKSLQEWISKLYNALQRLVEL